MGAAHATFEMTEVTDSDRTVISLTPPQEAAIVALLGGADTAAVAQVAGVSERTVRRWAASDPFTAALRAEARARAREAASVLLAVQEEAVRALREGLRSGSPATRVRAARAVLELGAKYLEWDHEERLSALESRVQTWQEDTGSGYSAWSA